MVVLGSSFSGWWDLKVFTQDGRTGWFLLRMVKLGGSHSGRSEGVIYEACGTTVSSDYKLHIQESD